MQMAVIEFARHVAGFENAHTAEVNPKAIYKVIDLMEEQKHITQKGGTMRLGAWDCELWRAAVYMRLTKVSTSASATATVMSSIANTESPWKKLDCSALVPILRQV